MDFPLTGLMDEDACHARLVQTPHPDGLACPRCGGDRLGVHRRHRAPALDHRCRDCRCVFTTALHETGPLGPGPDPAGLRPGGPDGAAGPRELG